MKAKFNLPYTLNDRVFTLHNNEVHSHLVNKIKAEMEINGLNDRIMQTLRYYLVKDNYGASVRTTRLENVKENELYATKEDAVKAWIKNQGLNRTEMETVLDEFKGTK